MSPGPKPFTAAAAIAVLAIAGVGGAWWARTPGVAAAAPPADTAVAADTSRADAALAAVRDAWQSEVERLREVARGIATNDETAEFVARPNLPFVDENFQPRRLAALGVDTVLIVDAARRPVFWRRPNDAANEGFPDAERFLAAMPDFAAAAKRARRGEPVLEGAVRFARGTQLATVLPIFDRARANAPRGYLVLARALDGAPARRILGSASVPVTVLAPDDAQLDARVRQRLALARGLAPVVVAERNAVRGYAPLHDVLGRVERVYALALPRAVPAQGAAAPATSRGTAWPLVFGLALVLFAAGGAFAWTRRGATPRRPAGAAGAAGAAAPAAVARAETNATQAASAARTREPDAVDVGGRGTTAPTAVPAHHPVPARDTAAANAERATTAVLGAPHDPHPFDETCDDAFLEQVLVQGAAGEEHSIEDVVVPDESPLELDVHVEPRADRPPLALVVANPPEMPARESATPVLRHARLVRGLVEAGRVHVHYQPQISTLTGGIVGVEALLRWEDEASVLRSAAELFAEEGPEPFAAATEFVLRRACADRRAWLAQIGRTLPVGVNVGLGELRDPAFLERVARILEASELAPAYLELEVPESALAHAGSIEAETLDRAYRMGLSIAVGGFVAADAPLRALTNLPVAKLKLARSLVGELPNDTHSRTVVDAILAVGRTLGVTVCAEGVETAAQAEYLEQRHCPLLQGWHVGRPMESDRFLELLQQNGIATMRLPLMDVEELESHARTARLL